MPLKSDKHRYSIDHIDLDKLILPFVVHTHTHILYINYLKRRNRSKECTPLRMHVCVCATHHIIIDGHDQLQVITPDGYGREEFKFVRRGHMCAFLWLPFPQNTSK